MASSAKQTQIKSELEPIGHIVTTDFRYKVPPYQRNFSWTHEEIVQLWDDIINAIREGRSEYFLGTIVVHEDREDKSRIVIDGQQRLSALTMIFSGIRTVYQEKSDERAAEVYTDYLGVRDRRTRVTESRLTLNALNEPFFQKIVIEDAPDENIAKIARDKSEAQSNILLSDVILSTINTPPSRIIITIRKLLARTRRVCSRSYSNHTCGSWR